jgi:phosphoserine phosphatase
MTYDWLTPFDAPFRDALLANLDRPGRKVACFDADGTLWSEDVGEAFFRWLVAGDLLTAIDCSGDVWEEYEERVAKDRNAGYTWAVQVMAGLSDAQVRFWGMQMAAAWPNYRSAMAGLARGLVEDAGFESWIVSASNWWIVDACAPGMHIPHDRVVGVRVAVGDDGVLTDTPVLPVPSGAGKVDAIAEAIGCQPVFAFGDSMGDFEMLSSVVQPMVVGRTDQPKATLVVKAAELGWPVHRF